MIVDSIRGKTFLSLQGVLGATSHKMNNGENIIHEMQVFYPFGQVIFQVENEHQSFKILELIENEKELKVEPELQTFKDGVEYALKFTKAK